MNVGSDEQQAVLQRFTEACSKDERVVAAFLGGSLVTEKADEWSDLDIYLITTDMAYDSFFAERQAFVRGLGKPVFLEDFNDFGFDMRPRPDSASRGPRCYSPARRLDCAPPARSCSAPECCRSRTSRCMSSC